MKRIELAEFAAIIGGTLPALPHAPMHIAAISIHSGRIQPETAFFALSGTLTDGHRYVADALAHGAVVAVVSRRWYDEISDRPDSPLVVVEDPLMAMQRLAAWQRRQLAGSVIAVTGSNGKTTLKDALRQALSAAYRCAASPGSFNGQLGVPLAILRAADDAAYTVLEVGVAAPGEMVRLQDIIRPDYGILTNIRWAHIAEFGARERIAAEKALLFADIPPHGWVLLPANDRLVDDIAAGLRCRVYRYGADADDLPVFRNRATHRGETTIDARFPAGEKITFTLDTLLPDAVAAIETAVCAAYLLGVDPERIAAALAHYAPLTTRLEVWKAPNGVTVLHASDNPDPLAAQTELREMEARSTPGGRRLFMLGGMSGMTSADYAEVGQLAAQHGVDSLIIVNSPDLATIETPFRTASPRSEIHRFPTLRAAREHLLADLKWGDTLLVKGSGLSGMDHIARDIVEAMAPNRFYLDLKAVAENVSRIRRCVGPQTRILAVLKALAYGSDAVQLARGLQRIGIDQIGVSSADEGRQLRQAGIDLPILVMMCTPDEVDKLTRYALTPVIYSFEIAEAIIRANMGVKVLGVECLGRPEDAIAQHQTPSPLPVHIEIDTGMGRLGVPPEQAADLAALLAGSGCLQLAGLMTHLASADAPEEDEATRRQLARFRQVRDELRADRYGDLICHAGATAGAIRLPEARFDMVRIGLGLYGLYPDRSVEEALELVLAVALVSRIVKIAIHTRGDRIGYGGTFVVPHDGFRAAAVPMGYHDGFPRNLGNVGYVLVDGHRAPICGRISMDSMIVDVSAIPSADVGVDVLLYGQRGGDMIRPEETAQQSGTIAYELLARLGPRVQRIFLGN